MANQMDYDNSVFGSVYKATEAKFSACLLWMIFQATKDGPSLSIPSEIMSPVVTGDNGKVKVKQPIADFLSNGEIYCKVCAKILKLETRPQSFWGVIQAVSKHGFYVVSQDGEAVSDTDLQEGDAFKINAHISLMESLLMAYSATEVTVQQIVSAVRRFSSFNAAKELPFDLEDALILWMNKVNLANDITYYQQKNTESSLETRQRFRFRKDPDKTARLFPLIDELHADLRDGKSLLSLMLFYCPESITMDSIKLSSPSTSEESIHNIELFRELCAQHVTTSVFSLRTEDFYYCNPLLKSNFLALLCDIFSRVELEKNFSNSLVPEKYGQASVIETLPTSNQSEDRHQNSRIHGQRKDTRSVNDRGPLDKVKTSPPTQGLQHQKHNSSSAEETAVYNNVDPQVKKSTRVGKDGLVQKPTDPSILKSRQPLLSKRSKQQMAYLEASKSNGNQEDATDVRIDDFDYQHTSSFSTSVDRANFHINPGQSFHAWSTRDATSTQDAKQPKISLDFRPDAAPPRAKAQEVRTSCFSETNHRQFEQTRTDKITYDKKDSVSGLRYTVTPTESLREFENLEALYRSTRSTSSSVVSPPPRPDITDQSLNGVSVNGLTRGIDSACDIGEEHGNVDLYDDGKSDDLNESITSEDLDEFRFEVLRRVQHGKAARAAKDVNRHSIEFDEPQFEDDEPYGFVQNSNVKQNYKGSSDFSPRPDSENDQEDTTYGLPGPGARPQRESYCDDHLDDDFLSTITEASEPTSPSVYSFESSATLSDNAETPKINLSRETLNQDLEEDDDEVTDSEEYNSQDGTYRAVLLPGGAVKRTNPLPIGATADIDSQSALQSKQFSLNSDTITTDSMAASGVLHTGVENFTQELRGSYTVNSGYQTVELARAAGLPVISNGDGASQSKDDYRRSLGAREDYRSQPSGQTGHGSQEGSDFEDVPIIIRTGSRSSRSRSSSSGISVDDGRLPTESELEDPDRPGLAVYSSLSEQTGGSPATFEAEDTDDLGNGFLRRPSKAKRKQRPDTWYGSSTDAQRNFARGRSASESAAEEVDAKNNLQSEQKADPVVLSGDNNSGSASLVTRSLGHRRVLTTRTTYRTGSIDEGTVSDDEKLTHHSRLFDRSRYNRNIGGHSARLLDALIPLSTSETLSAVDYSDGHSIKQNVDGASSSGVVLSRVGRDDSRDGDTFERLTWLDVSRERNDISRRMDSSSDGDKSIHVTHYERGPETSWAKSYANRPAARRDEDSSSEDESDEGRDREKSLGSRLASLRMQLEQRRKHIEKEKKKMLEKWQEERVKSAQNVFWFMIGKDGKKVSEESKETDDRKTRVSSLDSRKKVKDFSTYLHTDEPNEADTESSPNEDRMPEDQGHVFFPLNDVKAALPKSLDLKQGSNSPPMECSTPLSPVAKIQSSRTTQDYKRTQINSYNKDFSKFAGRHESHSVPLSTGIMSHPAYSSPITNSNYPKTSNSYSDKQKAPVPYSQEHNNAPRAYSSHFEFNTRETFGSIPATHVTSNSHVEVHSSVGMPVMPTQSSKREEHLATETQPVWQERAPRTVEEIRGVDSHAYGVGQEYSLQTQTSLPRSSQQELQPHFAASSGLREATSSGMDQIYHSSGYDRTLYDDFQEMPLHQTRDIQISNSPRREQVFMCSTETQSVPGGHQGFASYQTATNYTLETRTRQTETFTSAADVRNARPLWKQEPSRVVEPNYSHSTKGNHVNLVACQYPDRQQDLDGIPRYQIPDKHTFDSYSCKEEEYMTSRKDLLPREEWQHGNQNTGHVQDSYRREDEYRRPFHENATHQEVERISLGQNISSQQMMSSEQRISPEQMMPSEQRKSSGQRMLSDQRISSEQSMSPEPRISPEQRISSEQSMSPEQRILSGQRVSSEQLIVSEERIASQDVDTFSLTQDSRSSLSTAQPPPSGWQHAPLSNLDYTVELNRQNIDSRYALSLANQEVPSTISTKQARPARTSDSHSPTKFGDNVKYNQVPSERSHWEQVSSHEVSQTDISNRTSELPPIPAPDNGVTAYGRQAKRAQWQDLPISTGSAGFKVVSDEIEEHETHIGTYSSLDNPLSGELPSKPRVEGTKLPYTVDVVVEPPATEGTLSDNVQLDFHSRDIVGSCHTADVIEYSTAVHESNLQQETHSHHVSAKKAPLAPAVNPFSATSDDIEHSEHERVVTTSAEEELPCHVEVGNFSNSSEKSGGILHTESPDGIVQQRELSSNVAWEVENVTEAKTESPERVASSEEKGARRRSGGIALDIALNESPDTQQDGSGVAMFVGEASTATGMTPEQVRKRERFIQNRMKQQQEQKAKREADLEKRRRKEEKMKERKQMMEKKEEESKERLRRKRQEEEELLRKKLEEEEAARRKEEQMWRLRHFTSTREEHEVRHTVEKYKTVGHTSSSNSGSTGNIHSPDDEIAHAQGSSTFREYSGPPVYVKPSGKSNRKIIVNAISHCCLSGEVNRDAKDKCLQVLSSSDASHFLVLFRDGLKFRGLYSYAPETDLVTKLYGLGPRHITAKMLEKLFKYNSGGKEFTQIPAKSFSIQVDGMSIKKEFWTTNKSGVSKTNSNLKKGTIKPAYRK